MLTRILVAALCSIVVLGSAQARSGSPEQARKLIERLAEQRALASPGTASAVAAPDSLSITTGASTAAVTAGWNFGHADYCGWYVDGSNNQWFYVYTAEGQFVAAINNLYTGQALSVPCTNGYYFGWYVTNAVNGAFNQTISYPHY